MVESRIRADVAVIGSGPGGAVTATVCAEAGRSVLMLEEGGDLPLDSAPHFSRAELLEKYRGGGIGVAFGRAKIGYVEGRCVGGGSEINRGLYHRAPETLLERWRESHGVRDLSTDSLLPHFAACEATARVEYLPGDAPGISTRLRDGAEALGWRTIEAPRLFRYGADGGGRKQSISETFRPRFLDAGGNLLADTRARRIRREGDGWTVEAVRRTRDGQARPVTVHADRLFVAGGAVQTPALLRRSGIRHNIGDTLRLHPMLKLVALFPDEVNRPGDLDPVHQVKQFEPAVGMGCSISTPPLLGMALAAHPDAQGLIATEWRRMGIYYVQSTGGMGRVRNLPWCDDPLVRVRYGADDLPTLWQGMIRLAEALFAAGAQTVWPAVAGLPPLRSRADAARLGDAFRGQDGSLTAVHVFSSCPMGEDRRRTATDSYGRVWGMDGLHIADASLLCGPTSVNPQGTVMAIAHRNACHVMERDPR